MRYLFALLFFDFCLFIFAVHIYADGKPIINEFLPHPSSGNKEWVEFYVPDGTDVTNYWIDDDTDFANDNGNSHIKQITSFVQGSDPRHVVFTLSSSMFNNSGDTVALFDANGTLVDQYSYDADPGVDVSIGRVPDGAGNFQVLAYATRGSPNSPPKPTITPTPTPTAKPTTTPKPTVTPKPVKTSQATIVTSVSNNGRVLSDVTVGTYLGTSLSPSQIGSAGAHPTAILRTVAVQEKKTPTEIPEPSIMVEGATNSLPTYIALSIGGVLFISCGILVYLKKIKAKS